MSQSNEENPGGPEDEFDFYFRFTKPLVIYLSTEEDRSIAAAWVEKLEAEPENEQEKRLRLDYLKLLLFVLQRGRLTGIFRKQPPSGPLQPFPMGFNVSDMGNLMIDQDDIQGCGGGDARTIPYTVEISNDLREFVAAQEIPNFGVQMYYAWSSDDPIHKWSLFDEDKFPQYVLDKIKLLKEIKSDEKTGMSAKGCGAKKICDIPLIEKYTKTKVKSPQEIEKAQGRSYQAYMGLLTPSGGGGGGFKKCDDDPDKDPRRGKCTKKTQRKCSPGQNIYSEDLMQTKEEYEGFLSGLSGNAGNRSRGCPCPNPMHSPDCESQMKQQYDNQQQQRQNGNRSCSPKSRSDWDASVARGASRKPQMNYSGRQCPDQSAMVPDIQMNSCLPQRRSMPPPNKNCSPNRTDMSPPPTNNCNVPSRNGNMANSPSSCTCPCPGDENECSSRRTGGPSSPSERRCGESRPQPQGMKIWTTPNDASFQGLAGIRKSSPQKETMQCCDQQAQQQQQRGQEDTWCTNMNEMANPRKMEKRNRQMDQDRRDEERKDLSPSSRSYQTPSSSCPPRQAPISYSSCTPPVSPHVQRKNKVQDGQEICEGNGFMQQQEMDYCPGAYGLPVPPNSPYGQPEVPTNNYYSQEWRPQDTTMAAAKSLNFDYQSDFNDGCNNQPMNRSYGGNTDPCATRNDPCTQRDDEYSRMNEPCNTPQRTMPNRSKMFSPDGGTPYTQNTNNGRLYEMTGVIQGIKQKTEAHREKCEPAGGHKNGTNDFQDNIFGKTAQPRRQQCCPPPQPQCPPSQMKSNLPFGAEGTLGGSPYADSSYGKPLNTSVFLQSMSKQSQQVYCPSQQTRKAPPQAYDTFNTQKGMQNMNMTGPCPSNQSPGNFRPPANYSQGMNRSVIQPEECPEEEYDDCMLSGVESVDDRPQESSSAECFEVDDAEVMNRPCPSWPQASEPQPRSRGYMSMQKQKTNDFLQMMPSENSKKRGRIVCSTPKQSPFSSCNPNYGDPMNTNLQIEQTYDNYYALPSTMMSTMQIDQNYEVTMPDSFARSQPNDQSFCAPDQSKNQRSAAKVQRRRGGPSICDDNAQFDPCKPSCGY